MAGGKTRKAKQHCQNSYNNNTPYHQKGYSKRNQKAGGQKHHLSNRHVIDSIVEKAGIKPTDVVLEINPGLGNLTHSLIKAAQAVVAVEPDHALARALHLRFSRNADAHRLQVSSASCTRDGRLYRYNRVIRGDVRNCELPYFDICLANLPLESFPPITFKLLSRRPLFRCAVIMVQREFAMKLTAQPNDSDYCGLSANIQLLASVTHLTTIRKGSFAPPNKSDVSLIRLEPKNPPPINLKEWFGLVEICFLGKTSKMVSTVFRRNSVLSLLEKNNNKSLGDVSGDRELDISAYINALGDAFGDLSMEGDDEDEEMAVESGDTKRSEFKGRVLGVLQEARLEGKKCYQLTQTDLLSLLGLFNKAGIYFS